MPHASLPRWPASSADGLARAAQALRAGGLVLVPTESSYCLAASPERAQALASARELKSRTTDGQAGAGKPLLLLCASLQQAQELGRFEGRVARLAALWPAPLTLVVEPRDPELAAALGAAGLALRVPACEAARALAALAGAFTGTSANRAGEPPLVDPDRAEELSGDGRIAGILDGGVLPGGAPSTLVDARGENFVVLRDGAFPAERLAP